jgi:hypothetical protein
MAKLIQAYQRYCPRVKTGKTADLDEIAAYVAESTGLDKREIRMVLGKLQDATLHYARQGRGVKLEGIATLRPKADSRGTLSLGRRLDAALCKELNDMEKFAAQIENYEHRTWEEVDYRNAWNEEFPDDPIEE